MTRTETQRIVYRFFGQAVILLTLYAACSLLDAVQYLPGDPPTSPIPLSRLAPLCNTLIGQTLLTGLLGGGIYAIASTQAQNRLARENGLRIAGWLWTAALAAILIAELAGAVEIRRLLVAIQSLIAGMLMVLIALDVKRWSALPVVWITGMALHAACTLVAALAAGDTSKTLADGIRLYVALPLAALAPGYWLMHRFSNLTPGWVDGSLPVTAALLALAGALATLPRLYGEAAADWLYLTGNAALFVMPACLLVVAAHSYRALANRNTTATLAAHWYALGLLLLLLGIGLLGGLQAVPALVRHTLDTHVNDAQVWWTQMAVAAIMLGVVNQASAELHGVNGRITGLMPFWLVSFGVGGGGAALMTAGVAQAYLRLVSGAGGGDVRSLLLPLYSLWLSGLLLFALGVGVYALGFWLRRPPG